MGKCILKRCEMPFLCCTVSTVSRQLIPAGNEVPGKELSINQQAPGVRPVERKNAQYLLLTILRKRSLSLETAVPGQNVPHVKDCTTVSSTGVSGDVLTWHRLKREESLPLGETKKINLVARTEG